MRLWIGTASLICAALIGSDPGLAQNAAGPFRVGIGNGPSGCQSANGEDVSPMLAVYALHLESRLDVPVELCGIAPERAGAALVAGEIDFARVTARSEGADSVRPILRVRRRGHLPRTEFVIVGPSSDELLGGAAPQVADVVTLAANASEAEAMARILPGPSPVAPEPELINRALRSAFSTADANTRFIVNVGRYQVHCQQQADPCLGWSVLWRGFAPLGEAWAVPSSMDKERRYRLIGIHAVLHLERPGTFSTIAGDDAEEFEATEPWAFSFRNTL